MARRARFVWGDVRAWEHEPATVLATDDRTPESRGCIAHARATAVTALRDMLLRGIPAGRWRTGSGEGLDPREQLRHFVAIHAYPQNQKTPALPCPHMGQPLVQHRGGRGLPQRFVWRGK